MYYFVFMGCADCRIELKCKSQRRVVFRYSCQENADKGFVCFWRGCRERSRSVDSSGKVPFLDL